MMKEATNRFVHVVVSASPSYNKPQNIDVGVICNLSLKFQIVPIKLGLSAVGTQGR